MGRLTTHVLNTATGKPAQGMTIVLSRFEDEQRIEIGSFQTNADGRCPSPLLEGPSFVAGRYELLFKAGNYLRSTGATLSEPPFLDEIPIRFGISDSDAHYHVPLLISPYGYSTYRGS